MSRFASFAAAGPFEVGTYSVEHTSDDLSPKCVGSECLVKLTTYYPKGWQSLRKGGSERAPVAVLSAGFGLTAASYQSYARHLASYGWVCVCYGMLSRPRRAPNQRHMSGSQDVAIRPQKLTRNWPSLTLPPQT